jgi:hypothetical protein
MLAVISGGSVPTAAFPKAVGERLLNAAHCRRSRFAPGKTRLPHCRHSTSNQRQTAERRTTCVPATSSHRGCQICRNGGATRCRATALPLQQYNTMALTDKHRKAAYKKILGFCVSVRRKISFRQYCLSPVIAIYQCLIAYLQKSCLRLRLGNFLSGLTLV